MATFEEVGQVLKLMAQISGREFSPAAANLLLGDLSEYPPDDVLRALTDDRALKRLGRSCLKAKMKRACGPMRCERLTALLGHSSTIPCKRVWLLLKRTGKP
jgi:hypothetical protein